MHVAVIGLGSMGRAFAGRALAGGHRVTVWNRSPGRAEELVGHGAVEADSLAAGVADADVVLVVLADDDAVLQVCLGEGGLVDALSPAAVLANVSTVSPDVVHRLAERLPADRFLDAPVMGSPANVADGHCRFLLGGDRDTVSATGPLWDDLGAGSTYCGPVGNATTMKLVSNLLLIAGVAAMAEGIATARGLDIPDPLIREILSHSPVVSPASGVRLDSVMDGSHPGWFTPALARKDVRHAVALAEQAGLQVRIGPATEALLTDVIDGAEGGAAEWPDFSAVIEAI